MRIAASITTLVVIAALGARSTASDPPGDREPSAEKLESRFREGVKPFLESYCLGCHGKDSPKGDIDLSVYPTAESAGRDLAHWDLVLEQLQAGTMPPAKAKRRPDDAARGDVIDWIQGIRRLEARRHAGDPGPVLARRLSNAEYDHTVRDLTGVDLRPTREFPVDPANEAGFDNSSESLTMSPALVKKYLQAAREVADHLVLKPDGFAFAPHPMVADTDRDKYCVRRIIDFYKHQPIDLADYFLASWRFRHREVLGRKDASLADFAAEAEISPGYLTTVWSTLTEPTADRGPIAAIQSLWRDLPPPKGGASDDPRSGCQELRDFVNELRRKLTPEVGNLKSPGVHDGSQALVLWKNGQYAANRRRYAGGASALKPDSFSTGTPSARSLACPLNATEAARLDPEFRRFCSTFPDAFLISERARVYLDPKGEKANAGRLLSAGFHSMTGYYRDDAPLYDLILDDKGRRELDALWLEFDFVTGAPMRQYSSFLWFDRTDSTFMRGPEFDFARAEDKDAASEAKIKQLADVFLAKTRKRGASDVAAGAIRDYFEGISGQIRRVETTRLAAEPIHVEALTKFAERAYRHRLTAEEREGIVSFYRSLREKDGLGHEDAIRDSVVGILMSPHFCYRVDLPGAGAGIKPLSGEELASRLSYFLWSSMPDDELLTLAASGELQRPEILASQARRMLTDDRVRGLATEFGGNWLDFRRFEEHNSVDRGRFPSFNDDLRRSMFEEPIRFFVNVAQEDRSVLDFLDAKHTFVDASLARHYGMPIPDGKDRWVRIDDATPFGRGGLLSMAVFLTRNSPGLRTSPVKRGYWVVRRLLGEKIPAPPANVPDLPDDESKLGAITLREALSRHRADAACAGCHKRFDAIGLAYEAYGPIGESRVNDLAGHPVDARAEFPGGVEGTGIDGLRAYIDGHRRGEFVDNLCRKLLAYGLGRTLIPSDDETIEAMKARLASDGNRFGGLVESIVTSGQFRNRRN